MYQLSIIVKDITLIIRVIVKGDELEEANEEVVLTLTGKFIPNNPIKTN